MKIIISWVLNFIGNKILYSLYIFCYFLYVYFYIVEKEIFYKDLNVIWVLVLIIIRSYENCNLILIL